LIEDPWTYIFASVGAVGSATTAAALFFLWRQSKQTEKQIHLTQDEVEGTLRPWVGIDDVRRTEKGYVQVLIRNTGSIPAKIVKAQRFFSSTMITQEQLRSGVDIIGKFVIFPNINKTIRLSDSSGTYPYIGILIQYEYAKNKHGEIGLVVQYNDLREKFDFLDEFVN
jgi:hypothetical protein